MSNLILHCGAVPMSYDQLRSMNKVHYTPLSPTHRPVPHHEVVDMVKQSLNKHTDYSIVSQQYGVSGKKGTELFALLSLRKDGNTQKDYEMFIGFRHSNQMRFAFKLGIGDKFFICDNLAWDSEHEIRGTKHTLNINSTAQLRVDELTKDVLPMETKIHERNERYRRVIIPYKVSDHLIMELVRQKAIPKTKVTVIDAEYRRPSYDYSTHGSSLLDLKHACTHVAKGSFYTDQIKRSKVMHKVFDEYIGLSA